MLRRWSVDLGGEVSYPLIVEGQVFVTVGNVSGYGTKLHAFDLETGERTWGPVDLGGTYWWSAAAYDAGRVFTLNYDGQMRAFAAADGAELWSMQLPGQWSFTSAPTAWRGIVYTGGAGLGGTVYAVDGATGAVLWTRSVDGGDHSSPAVSDAGMFVSYACQQSWGFDRLTGVQQWHHDTICSGGGGKTGALSAYGLYVRDAPLGNVILDAKTGVPTGGFSGGPIPAFSSSSGFFLNGSTLEARDLPGGAVLWSFTGDGGLVTAPVVVNGFVYVGSSSGNLYALRKTNGELATTTNVGAAMQSPDEHNVSRPLTGLAAGLGHLAVPGSGTLTVYDSVQPLG